MLACEHKIYEPMSIGVYYKYFSIVIGVYNIDTYIIDSFHFILYLYYKHIYYKYLQTIVGTYLLLGSRLIGSCPCTHMLASLLLHLTFVHCKVI